mgnify:FL=1
MFLKKVESKGLAHNSWMIGDAGEVFVVDPRRDVSVYMDIANENGYRISGILETHRHEDFIIGSKELGEKTGAPVYVSAHEDLGHVYGEAIEDGREFSVGNLKIRAIHTPGHTLGHLCYAVYEKGEQSPYLVFTGDCLFTGDLGRTDFYGEENLEKMTGLLYDSVFEKLMPLGDHVLVLPAHGAGSACGSNMKELPFSTLGYERLTNPELQAESREAFIEKFGRMRIKPRYFEAMEVYNVKGAAYPRCRHTLPLLSLEEVREKGYTIIDARSRQAYSAAHIPSSIYLSRNNFSTFLGTLFPNDEAIVFTADYDDMEMIMSLYRSALRVGFDQVKGYLQSPVEASRYTDIYPEALDLISAEDFLALDDAFLLDVRKAEEFSDGDPAENRVNIPLQLLYKEYEKLPKN